MQSGSHSLQQMSSAPFVGLANRKFYTCFMNSVMQCLVGTPNLLRRLTGLKNNPQLNQRSQYRGRISSQLVEFATTYESAKQQKLATSSAVDVALRRFLKVFADEFSQFQSYEQQDVHEFLSCLLLCLNEDLNVAPKFDKPLDERLVDADQSKINRADYFRACKTALRERDESIVNEMFQGLVGDCITCQSCQKPKFKYDTEYILSLPFGDVVNQQKRNAGSRRSQNRALSLSSSLKDRKQPLQTVSLDDCLAKFFELEHLPETELLDCMYCNKKRKVSKQTEVSQLPAVLIVHLKRFFFNEHLMDYDKLDDYIELKPQI